MSIFMFVSLKKTFLRSSACNFVFFLSTGQPGLGCVNIVIVSCWVFRHSFEIPLNIENNNMTQTDIVGSTNRYDTILTDIVG